MRLALVHKRYDRLGGAEWDCYELSHQLAARGHDVHLVVGECRVPTPDGMRLHRVPVLRTGKLAKLASFAVTAPRVWRAVGADVVIGFGRTVGWDLFRASGGVHKRWLARVAAERGALRDLRQRLSPYHRLMLAIERRQYAADTRGMVLAVSELSREEILATYPAMPAAKVSVLHYGVDVERFHPARRATEGAEVRAELGIGAAQPVVLLVGSGFRRKGVDVLLDVWRRAPPAGAALVVVGNDQHLAHRQRAARELPGPVVFTGPRRDVERFYAAADVFALPSLHEGCPVAILEALASGVPVVTSRATGAPELLPGPLADLLVDDPRDVGAITARLRLGLDPARRATLVAAARAAGCANGLGVAVDRMEAWCRWAAAARERPDV
ncbi:MAG: glycosyltransferase family 4 protein [Deltaproteobacteria bacterium]|nr:glycosyltransferase family 4 protein [Deltaproteobacteria bacterium]